jgi:hypothetical protein
MGGAHGFEYDVRADGSVVISPHGRKATVLRGARAAEFLSDAEANPRDAMARWTGNCKRGNERATKQDPRNRD